jgi:hypothetical protein
MHDQSLDEFVFEPPWQITALIEAETLEKLAHKHRACSSA